jgi:diguanylate cyclase (GGDEF)-like protein
MSDLSRRDTLTGAQLRETGRERFSTELARADRTHGPVVFVFLDVEGLQRVNDESGPAAGDLVLRAVGNALVEGLRTYDVVVRYGRTEFVCCLPGTTVVATTTRLAEIAEALSSDHPAIRLRCGVVDRGLGETLDHVIGRAAGAMTEAGRPAPSGDAQAI